MGTFLRIAFPWGLCPAQRIRNLYDCRLTVIPLLRCHGNAVTEGVYVNEFP